MITLLITKLFQSILHDLISLRNLIGKLAEFAILVLYAVVLLPIGALILLIEKYASLRKAFYSVLLILLIFFVNELYNIYETRDVQNISAEQAAKLSQYSANLTLLKNLHEADPTQISARTAYIYDSLKRAELNFPSISEQEFIVLFNN